MVRIGHVVLLALAVASFASTQKLAVYESETNAERYHGVHQAPLRSWLAERGQAFEVIGDEAAADPQRLAAYAVVLASSVYIVPDAAASGLVGYLRGGGRVIWFDSPAGCRDEAFRAGLGLGSGTTYAPLSEVTIERVGGPHPAALSTESCVAKHLVGNAATSASPDATVLYEMGGTAQDGASVRFPAVVLSECGDGKALVYNWVVWANREPGVQAILADGLDYMLADARLAAEPLVVAAAAERTHVRQPEPVVGLCKAYVRAGAQAAGVRCTASLLSPDGKAVAEKPLGELSWTRSDAEVTAGIGEVSIPTGGLPDGAYTLSFRLAGGPLDATATTAVELSGERWAALKRAEHERRKLLEPTLLGTLGDYDAEPRTPEGRVDIPRLMEQIKTAHMNMYDFLIWHAETDWEDFRAFLPVAKEAGIKVWVTLCPPSEQGGGFPWSEPYRLDYVKWADEIGQLAEKYDNLVALVIDDFWSSPNLQLFTPDYIAQVTETLRRHNPTLAFLPTIYWPTVGDVDWIEAYSPVIDGIVFPYCEYVTGDDLQNQLAACRAWIGPEGFLLVNVYAAGSGGSEAPPRTEAYMRKTLTVSREHSDGIRIYCLPKGKLLDDPRYAVTAELYGEWAAPPAK